MFTGLIGEMGTVESLHRGQDGARLRVGAGLACELSGGDSVAVAGACLTVAVRGGSWFEADAMSQTLALSTLGDLEPGDRVNLELALRAGDPLGGHLVQGHLDGVAVVREARLEGIARRLAIEVPAALLRYVAERGSVAVDGASLTIAGLRGRWIEVALIPETLERTTLGALEAGDRVNLEVDVVARYLERLASNVDEQGDREDE